MMFAIIGIPLITYACYKFACGTILDLSNESKAQFGYTMLGMITAQNVCAAVLIVMDLLMGFPKYLAIIAVVVCFICTAIEVIHVKKILMGNVPIFETKEQFHKRLRERTIK